MPKTLIIGSLPRSPRTRPAGPIATPWAETVPFSSDRWELRGEGVRVHTVGIGTTGVEVPMAEPSGDRGELDVERHDVDTAALKEIAALTGGRFFAVRNAEQLTAVYRDIADTMPVVTATVDADGNRTAVTTDLDDTP